ncbi:hypothetical protein [Micromonospora sp. WMMD1155]|uniref:hypothetical protein n=1 Tax=Micromonospora sp. WMMD1155 TaxID=3016094 RepID=UPI002499D6CC|nr:hypothetical protein [Micromonospora sp. WMMD1155]WFE53019.1 hypothetical protein O7617_23060 [Micromonospora sp. WMMD1155]
MASETTPVDGALCRALSAADLSARALIREVNWHLTAVGHEALHPTAAYSWLKGSTPASPAVRYAVAVVLTRVTGIAHRPTDLWPETTDPVPLLRATDDLVGPRGLRRLLDIAAAWTALSGAHQGAVQPSTGPLLITSALDATAGPPAERLRHPAADRIEHVLPAMAGHLESTLADLRRLDDQTGGGAVSHRWVRNALAGVLDLLRNAQYSDDVGRRLLRTAGGLAQLAGWMCHDSNLTGPAQRYHLLALRLAKASDSAEAVANNLGMLAYQMVPANPAEAVRLATAATDAARSCATAVRARALGRLATAHAAAGDLHAYQTAADACRTMLHRARPEDTPADLYYYTPRQQAAEHGHALVLLAATYPPHARRLLIQATDMLTPLAMTDTDETYRRSALLHGIHLARAHLLAHDRPTATATIDSLAQRVPGVQSVRCRSMLADLRGTAHRHLPTATREAVDKALSTA